MYGLRQARYDAAAADVSDWAASAAENDRELLVLDVGCGNGTLARHLEPRPHFDRIRLFGTDVRTHADSRTHHYSKIFMSDLMSGQPEVPTEGFDVVVCEQVLEHLERLDLAIGALERALKPNGHLIVGVPIFIGPLAYLRRQYVRLSQILAPERHWSHVQSFSLASFLATMRNYSSLEFVGARGFRIVSEGLVAPLENYRWWWRLNRSVGAIVPWACTEIQAIFVKGGTR